MICTKCGRNTNDIDGDVYGWPDGPAECTDCHWGDDEVGYPMHPKPQATEQLLALADIERKAWTPNRHA
jgi:hypothetical protein